MVRMLDGEFAFVLYNKDKGQIVAARDPMGIRPMFYGYTKVDHQISFASEAKALMPVCDEILMQDNYIFLHYILKYSFGM